MLLKPTGAVPHVGGQLIQPGEPYYEIIRAWIADGAKLDLDHAARHEDRGLRRPTRSSQQIGAKQQIRVLATYADGEVRDVTREAFLESGNTEVATAEPRRPDDRASAAARRRSWPATKGPTPPRRSP